MSIYVVLVI